MRSIGHQRTVSTSRDPVLLLVVNPMWYRPPLSLVRLLQVFFGLPLFLCPWGFHGRGLLAMLSFCFLNVCPIHVHLLLLSKTSANSWPVAFHTPQVHISHFIIPSYSKNHSEWSVYKYLDFVDQCLCKISTFLRHTRITDNSLFPKYNVNINMTDVTAHRLTSSKVKQGASNLNLHSALITYFNLRNWKSYKTCTRD